MSSLLLSWLRELTEKPYGPWLGRRLGNLSSRLLGWPVEFKKMGVFGLGGGSERGPGRFCSMACWNGLSQGKLQNCRSQAN
jgi:hypothetical protein